MERKNPKAFKYTAGTTLDVLLNVEHKYGLYHKLNRLLKVLKTDLENNLQLFKLILELKYDLLKRDTLIIKYCQPTEDWLDEEFCKTLIELYMKCDCKLIKDYRDIIYLLIVNKLNSDGNDRWKQLFLNQIFSYSENDKTLLKSLQLLYNHFNFFYCYSSTVVINIIEKSILTTKNDILTFISLKILPLTENNHNILRVIVQQLQKTRNYLHLCNLSDYLLTNPRKNYHSIVEQIWFWEMIENGLNDHDLNSRKSALFLLKRVIVIEQFTVELSPNNYLVKFDKQTDRNVWDTFIFLYETLDEKQSHIIEPGLKSLISLAELHPTWRAIIYRRLLSHDSAIIQRYGIDEIFKLQSFERIFFLKISNDLIGRLNNSYLYQGSTTVQLKEFFENLDKSKLLDEFLLRATQIKWQAVPFFHVCYALVKSAPTIDNINEDTMRKLIDVSDTILNLSIRKASQCLLLYYLQRFNQISIELLHQIQYLFKKCSICMDSPLWAKTMKWLETKNGTFNTNEIQSANILLLLNSANLIKNEDLLELLEGKLNEFTNINMRHSIAEHLYESLIWITEIYEEISNSNRIEFKQQISDLVQASSAHLFGYIIRNFHENNRLEITIIDNYLRLLKLLVNNFADFKIISKCREYLMDETSSIEFKYYSLSLLKILIESASSTPSYLELICELHTILRTLPPLTKQDTTSNRQITSGYYKVLNSLELICVKYRKKFGETSLDRILARIYESLECGGRESVSITIELIRSTLPYAMYNESFDIPRLMSICWNETMELKKCDLFWNAMLQFIGAFFKIGLFLFGKFRVEILKYGNMILEHGQQTRGLTKLLFDQILLLIQANIKNYSAIEPLFKSFIVKGLIFGTNLRKDERIEFETIEFIRKLNYIYDFGSVENKYNWDQQVRILSIEMVSRILSEHQSPFIDEFLHLLIVEYQTNNRVRYYANSNTHLIKNRLLQSMLLLQPHLNRIQNLKLFQFAYEVLKTESPQPSVRYQLEWLLILTIHHDCELIANFSQSCVHEFSVARVSSLISIVSVVYHLTLLNPTQFLPYANSIILPLTMMSNFNVRLYAQVTFLWILEECAQQTKYETIYQSLRQALNPPNTICQPYEKLKNDFFLTNFHPIKNLTIETIYYDLPRLTLLADEALDVIYFDDGLYKNLKNTTDKLKSCTPISWVHKEVITLTESSENDLQKIYQKKIIPSKAEISELDTMESTQKFQRKCGNLIVVASLIERAPNLGGLSRTCEIFGVEQYVINNLRQTESKEFQNLSVSSEKWLDITDVPINQLAGYLFAMKNYGYTIVGCEQSTNSVQLTEFTFPEKTVLLLGNEKEGIPPNLLSIVDICVEIPQCGVIRSLNVHVSGAITIWQYASQHLFSNTKS